MQKLFKNINHNFVLRGKTEPPQNENLRRRMPPGFQPVFLDNFRRTMLS